MMEDEDRGAPGWKWIDGPKKWHFYGMDRRSLCGKWMALNLRGTELGNDESPDNCAMCRSQKRLSARKGR